MASLYVDPGYVDAGYVQTGVTISWAERIIFIPKTETTLIQSVPTEVRTLDINVLRLALKDLEDDEEGSPFPDTHRHNTEVSVGGVLLARVVEIINGYTITFEDGVYGVTLYGANSNIADVLNRNSVSVTVANSAGLINAGGAPTPEEVADAVWATDVSGNNNKFTEAGGMLNLNRKMNTNRMEQYAGSPGFIILWDDDSLTPVLTAELRDAASNGVAAAAGAPAKRKKAT